MMILFFFFRNRGIIEPHQRKTALMQNVRTGVDLQTNNKNYIQKSVFVIFAILFCFHFFSLPFRLKVFSTRRKKKYGYFLVIQDALSFTLLTYKKSTGCLILSLVSWASSIYTQSRVFHSPEWYHVLSRAYFSAAKFKNCFHYISDWFRKRALTQRACTCRNIKLDLLFSSLLSNYYIYVYR